MSLWRRRALAALAALMAVVALALDLAARAPVARADYTVSVTRTPVTRPIAGDFLGLAIEYNTIPAWSPEARHAVDRPLVGLIRGLEPTGRPLIRIGGQSTDRTWWPVRGLAQPRGVTYSLSAGWMAATRSLADSLDARLMLGLNLEANRTRIPQQEASRFMGGLGAKDVASFQLGNEPELYRSTPWYRVAGGHPIPWYSNTGAKVLARAPGWGPAAFDEEFRRFSAPLPRSIPLAGPEAGVFAWMQAFVSLLSPRSRVRMLTAHGYGNNGCVHDPSGSEYPTIPHLLALPASRLLLAGLTDDVAAAHRNGASFRLDEMGSVTCNGAAGVSNTMASALWVMDALFSLARQGVDGVNLHTYPGSVNGLFDLARAGGRWKATVHPLYYGALMFARAAPAGSRLVRLGVSGDQERVRAWATLGTDRMIRVLIINDGESGSSRVRVRAPAGYGAQTAMGLRLSAPSAAATRDVTLGGRQFGETSTGVLGAPKVQSERARAGVYTVSLAAGSAALLALAPRG